MRICCLGKYPPIQGGVSMRNYWHARALASCGHEVHVVTNALEVQAPFRMHMQPEDWETCEETVNPGSLRVHWTNPVDKQQSYIPMASPFVSKLASIAASLHEQHSFDVIYSHYLEPYGVAAHLAAEMTGVPHVLRTAGSDAGRLWHYPQLEALYDHVLRRAVVLIAKGEVAARAKSRGVSPDRIAVADPFVIPGHLFTHEGSLLDLNVLRDEVRNSEQRDAMWGEFTGQYPHIGIYGKLGEPKGSFALLAALARLKQSGKQIGLVALAHGQPAIEQKFRETAQELGLTRSILQLPFLPHWRVPEFLRGCLAVCCLETNFPIRFHSPIITREVLLCGTCLVGSAEVVRKLPNHEMLPNGYGCVVIEDALNPEALSQQLAAIIDDPSTARDLGMRGCKFARKVQRDAAFPPLLESVLIAAAGGQPIPADARWASAANSAADAAAASSAPQPTPARRKVNGDGETPVLVSQHGQATPAVSDPGSAAGDTDSLPSVTAVRMEHAIAAIQQEADNAARDVAPLARLCIGKWALADDDLCRMVTVRDLSLRIIAFDQDVLPVDTGAVEGLPRDPVRDKNYVVVRGGSGGERRPILQIDAKTATILALSDGTRTALQIAKLVEQKSDEKAVENVVRWTEALFVAGLISLRDTLLDPPLDTLVLHRLKDADCLNVERLVA